VTQTPRDAEYFRAHDKEVIAEFTANAGKVGGTFDGNDVHPGWVHNLRAHPRVLVQIGADAHEVVARELPRAERDASYPQIVAVEPGFGVYEARAKRVIPLFELQK
jgi:deazaflavin-dependent oxidoreductase (nitroreductase family)